MHGEPEPAQTELTGGFCFVFLPGSAVQLGKFGAGGQGGVGGLGKESGTEGTRMPKRKGKVTYMLPTTLPCDYRGEDSSRLIYPQTLHAGTLRGWAWCVTLAVPGV